jgi:hypothetical protein
VGPPPEPFRWDGRDLIVLLPIKTKNEANHFAANWKIKAARRKQQRRAVARLLVLAPRVKLPVTVTLTRHSSGRLDAHDGLPGAFKSVVDELAVWLGLPANSKGHADDSDPRVTWKYDQAKAPPKQTWVTVRFSPREDGAA